MLSGAAWHPNIGRARGEDILLSRANHIAQEAKFHYNRHMARKETIVREQRAGTGTLIAENTAVQGNIRFAGELVVKGRVEGDVFGEGDEATLTISESGTVVGQIEASTVVVNGRVEGDVRCLGKLELAERGHLTGNVTYRVIEMRLGAVLEGQLVRGDTGGRKEADPPAIAAPEADDAAEDGRKGGRSVRLRRVP